ncbi:hypothetical protein [Desulfobulbus alkaliphilus]|uniref:hypothetical protein n=1 Tax=Desulfobulbus alkaliphilus TaxID=869814 RepID=UPI0019637C4B|nr:hypothetical protein [Desulfobulbus alkaliphilus]MBM9535843.1 hypothetical protein [Desulfobulbus alkaliphilus]
MVTTKNAGILLLVLLAVVFALFRLLPSDEKAIRKQLTVFAQNASKKADEKPVEGLRKSRRIADLFNDPCRISVEAVDFTGTFSRQQIMDRILMVRATFNAVTVKLHDISIQVSEENSADVRMTLRLSGQRQDHAVADVQEISATLEKIDGDWLFTSVRVVEVLSR